MHSKQQKHTHVLKLKTTTNIEVHKKVYSRGWYHGARRQSSDDGFHSPTVIPPSALDKLSIMKRYHCQWTCSHPSPCRSPTIVTLHDTWFVKCRWWNDGWTVKTVITRRSSASMIPAPEQRHQAKYCNHITCNSWQSVHTFHHQYTFTLFWEIT